jgi:hypothetical protein
VTGTGTGVDCTALGGEVCFREISVILTGSFLLPFPSGLFVAGGDVG